MSQQISVQFIENILDTYNVKGYHIKTIDNTHTEKLEVLGDAILMAIITDHLFNQDRDLNDIIISRQTLTSRNILCQLAIKIGLENSNKNILEDMFERVIGIIYLNCGFDITKTLVINLIDKTFKI